VRCHGTGITRIIPPDVQRSIDPIVLGAVMSMEDWSRLDILAASVLRAYFTVS